MMAYSPPPPPTRPPTKPLPPHDISPSSPPSPPHVTSPPPPHVTSPPIPQHGDFPTHIPTLFFLSPSLSFPTINSNSHCVKYIWHYSQILTPHNEKQNKPNLLWHLSLFLNKTIHVQCIVQSHPSPTPTKV